MVEIVKEFKVGQSGSGAVLLSSINITKTRYGKDMFMATAIGDNGVSCSASCFDASVTSFVGSIGETSILADVTYKVDEYNGSPSMNISSINQVYDMDDKTLLSFFKSIPAKPNVVAIMEVLGSKLTEKGLRVAKEILNAHKKELAVGMAAMYGGYHDGVVGGLLNHIRKVLRYTEIAMAEYEDTFSPEERDLVYLGITFHDIGKLIELHNGGYSEISIVPHTFLGIEILNEHKDVIVSEYNEMFYRELQAIIAEHHGEFGERPKTVYAYLVHVIDLLDSRVSGLQRILDEGEKGKPMSVKFDDYRLQFNRYGEG